MLPGLTGISFSRLSVKLTGTFSHSKEAQSDTSANSSSVPKSLKGVSNATSAYLLAGAFGDGSQTDTLYPDRKAASAKNPPICPPPSIPSLLPKGITGY